jgi:hypothetical protein
MNEGGVILWHDYHNDWPGVIKYLNELSMKMNLVRITGTSLVYFKNMRHYYEGTNN